MKKFKIGFLTICMFLLFIPLLGMTFRPTLETTENRILSSFPSLIKDNGGINLNFFSAFETYFSEHFAFRNELVATDGKIQGKIFKTSANNNVIYGNDGWLYYSSTIPDYSGTNVMNERELENLKRNISIANKWLKDRGITMLLTVPPNKNTLYGEHMPYYSSTIISNEHTLFKLNELCEEENILYADLYSTLKDENEVLYLKRDSHWNNKGALIAYNEILNTIKHPHDDYSDLVANRAKNENGDLNKMLYSYYGEKEVNYHYDIPQNYEYISDTKSVEDGLIETKCNEKEKALVMFRDSFGNTLIPLIANQFEQAYFTKESTYRLDNIVSEQNPDIVIFEKVERNLRDYIKEPPIITMPEIKDISISEEALIDGMEIEITTNLYDPSFYELKGKINESLSKDSDIIVYVDGKYLDAYDIYEDEFLVYLKKIEYPNKIFEIEVLLKENDTTKRIYKGVIESGE